MARPVGSIELWWGPEKGRGREIFGTLYDGQWQMTDHAFHHDIWEWNDGTYNPGGMGGFTQVTHAIGNSILQAGQRKLTSSVMNEVSNFIEGGLDKLFGDDAKGTKSGISKKADHNLKRIFQKYAPPDFALSSEAAKAAGVKIWFNEDGLYYYTPSNPNENGKFISHEQLREYSDAGPGILKDQYLDSDQDMFGRQREFRGDVPIPYQTEWDNLGTYIPHETAKRIDESHHANRQLGVMDNYRKYQHEGNFHGLTQGIPYRPSLQEHYDYSRNRLLRDTYVSQAKESEAYYGIGSHPIRNIETGEYQWVGGPTTAYPEFGVPEGFEADRDWEVVRLYEDDDRGLGAYQARHKNGTDYQYVMESWETSSTSSLHGGQGKRAIGETPISDSDFFEHFSNPIQSRMEDHLIRRLEEDNVDWDRLSASEKLKYVNDLVNDNEGWIELAEDMKLTFPNMDSTKGELGEFLRRTYKDLNTNMKLADIYEKPFFDDLGERAHPDVIIGDDGYGDNTVLGYKDDDWLYGVDRSDPNFDFTKGKVSTAQGDMRYVYLLTAAADIANELTEHANDKYVQPDPVKDPSDLISTSLKNAIETYEKSNLTVSQLERQDQERRERIKNQLAPVENETPRDQIVFNPNARENREITKERPDPKQAGGPGLSVMDRPKPIDTSPKPTIAYIPKDFSPRPEDTSREDRFKERMDTVSPRTPTGETSNLSDRERLMREELERRGHSNSEIDEFLSPTTTTGETSNLSDRERLIREELERQGKLTEDEINEFLKNLPPIGITGTTGGGTTGTTGGGDDGTTDTGGGEDLTTDTGGGEDGGGEGITGTTGGGNDGTTETGGGEEGDNTDNTDTTDPTDTGEGGTVDTTGGGGNDDEEGGTVDIGGTDKNDPPHEGPILTTGTGSGDGNFDLPDLASPTEANLFAEDLQAINYREEITVSPEYASARKGTAYKKRGNAAII